MRNRDERFRPGLNFRQLGGYETIDHRTVRSGLIFRSGGLYLFNAEEQKAFLSYGIQYVLDLRAPVVQQKKPDPQLEGVTFLRHDMFVSKGGEGIDFSAKGMRQTGEEGNRQLEKLKYYYEQQPFENESFHVLFEALKEHKVPICYHCATGKDRTGTASIMILLALGCSEETALADYELTNEYRKDVLEEDLAASREEIARHPELRQLIQMRRGVDPEIGKAVIASIHKEYGTFENYFLKEYGWDKEELEEFRDFYLE